MYEDSKKYHLVFTDSNTYPLAKFLKPGFRHVQALHFSPHNLILFEPTVGSLKLYSLPIGTEETYLKFYREQNPHHTILHVNVSPNKDMPVWRLGPISCVSLIQYLLGVYWPLTVTPYALYSKLLTQTPEHIRILDDGWPK